ncbi:FAD-dependent oxidoreductase [Synoicihabitans lomoniglobus]|uniref:FAD-dependent oxidoreductase n=2 Tax=Synoicihabitans lomoniglobus TaxID=2909285 RepID=A0AAF0CNY1_9BACT|nr:FAD-dependent oxidoreductase [Opitutaceae bacterium LMO-M01]
MTAPSKSMRADVVVVGGGVGGCAAALTLADLGHDVIMTEEYVWIGGQLTSQAVPPDEHGWIERFGCTATYRRFREAVRSYYRAHYPLTAAAAAQPYLNPGNGWVSPLCHEPRVALAVLEAMLAPHVSSGRLVVLRQHRPVAVSLEGSDRVATVTVVNDATGTTRCLTADMFLDATENGDLLPLAEVEHVTGSEARAVTGEPGAAEVANPHNIQAFSVCFVMDAAGEAAHRDHLVSPPDGYERHRVDTPRMTPPWPGPMLSWRGLNPRTMAEMDYRFHPHGEKPGLFSGLWSFRRIVDRSLFRPGFFPSDVCLVNWPMIDYLDGDLLTTTAAERERHLRGARDLSLAMMCWLQSEAPRPDGGRGWPELRLRPDLTGTADGLAMAPYIRESRRIRALHTIVESEVSADQRPGETLAERYDDSVGIGYYRIDLHPTTAGDNYHDVPSLPFRIPLGAMVPVRMVNLLPACKNIGTTHITNGCYRLHPVEWNIGEAAGLLAATCLRDGIAPQAVAQRTDRRTALQQALTARGVELAWPENLVLDDGDPHAHAR